MNDDTTAALAVSGLRVRIGDTTAVDGISLQVRPGECVAIVGESGAGKSLTARALLGLAPAEAVVTADTLVIDGHDATALRERGWRRLRGRHIALVSQDALVSLDPLRRVGAEIEEPLRIHDASLRQPQRRARVDALLASVAMPDAPRRARQYPHELSGGLRQRALIASALAADPAVLIADEPTTALDATVQARVLDVVRDVARRGVAVVFISHDFAAVGRVADRVAVMRAGAFVEVGTVAEILEHPTHAYTRQLVAATRHAPRVSAPLTTNEREAPVVRVKGVTVGFDRVVVDDVSLDLVRGRTLGLVGESGSGKTTLARVILGVHRPDSGEVRIDALSWGAGNDRALRRRVQIVHQNTAGAFDPRWRIDRSLREALARGGVPRGERRARAAQLLREVGLDPSIGRRRPRQLSGGQRQRAAIARALAVGPDILLLDEPVSALDPSVREHILALLQRLQHDRGLTMLFISHDLDVVASVADDVAVMKDGVIVEAGATADVFAAPRHPFTRELLAAGGLTARAGR